MIKITHDKNLRHLNTFGMDVSCRRFIGYDSVSDLAVLYGDRRHELGDRVLHIGGGSNLLFTGDYPGTVLHSLIGGISVEGESDGQVMVTVGAGVVFDRFVEWSAEQGLWGAENLSLIPGETGAAAVQNIGAYGVEIADIVDRVNCFDTETLAEVSLSRDGMKYGYRDSLLKHLPDKGRFIVTSVTMKLSTDPRPQLGYGSLGKEVAGDCVTPRAVREAVIRTRRAKLPDPAETGSAGSFFKNPVVSAGCYDSLSRSYSDMPCYRLPDGTVKIPAAWLIDRCGLKGARRGGAAVWRKQPLVIVNATGDATPGDVIALERLIIDTVADRFGITLSPEVEHI